MNALRKELTPLAPPKIVCKQRNVRTGGKAITLAERRIHAAGVDIAVEDE
jgi:hypothetical protein